MEFLHPRAQALILLALRATCINLKSPNKGCLLKNLEYYSDDTQVVNVLSANRQVGDKFGKKILFVSLKVKFQN